ncbi:MAG: hypothetical protein WCK67_13145 [bacterium]
MKNKKVIISLLSITFIVTLYLQSTAGIDTQKISKMENQINSLIYHNNTNKAEKKLNEILKIYEKTPQTRYKLIDKENHVATYLNYGLLKEQQKDYNSAIAYMNKALILYNSYKLHNINQVQMLSLGIIRNTSMMRHISLREGYYEQNTILLEREKIISVELINNYNYLIQNSINEYNLEEAKAYLNKALNLRTNDPLIIKEQIKSKILQQKYNL